MDEQARYDLLKKINSKLVWIIVLLVLIMLNTCSLGDNLSDAVRDARRAETSGEYFAPRPAPQTPSAPAEAD